jgi:hypothetical protein
LILSSLLKGLIVSDVRIKRRVEFDIAKLVGISSIKGLRHNFVYQFTVNEPERMQVHNEPNAYVFSIFKTCRGSK